MSITSCGLGHGGQPLFRELYAPREVEHILSVSHATLYRLIAAGRLDARKVASKTVITASSIRQFIADLPKAEVGEAA
jgi:predicted DNA-binding transcriptional regulator AlpA